ncbi:hypothetical protein predicted by Glimmer/Critica [Lactiplantibacillus plantarum]|nr:hypothetical protein predicted by Glimmer/Critica [Lactiplantibacillus plantarum]
MRPLKLSRLTSAGAFVSGNFKFIILIDETLANLS